MKEDSRTLYERNVQDRSTFRYYLGYIVRFKQWVRHERIRRIARKRGAVIGKEVVMPM